MGTIRFQTLVGKDQIIRLSEGVAFPPGQVEVIVRAVNHPDKARVNPLEPTRKWLPSLATEAELQAPELPSDLAENHDHYAHGKPKP